MCKLYQQQKTQIEKTTYISNYPLLCIYSLGIFCIQSDNHRTGLPRHINERNTNIYRTSGESNRNRCANIVCRRIYNKYHAHNSIWSIYTIHVFIWMAIRHLYTNNVLLSRLLIWANIYVYDSVWVSVCCVRVVLTSRRDARPQRIRMQILT